jgi:RHS repeat-associated protein
MKHKYQIIAAALALCILSTVGASLASSTVSVPEFQSMEQLREQQTTKGINRARTNEYAESKFYTGKILETDSGRYVFLFRDYDPTVSRWTASDPSGFPDGPNNSKYLNFPTFGLDSAALWAIKLTSASNNPAGGSSGTVNVFTPLVVANIRASSSLFTNIDKSGTMTGGFINANGTGRIWRADGPAFDWLATNYVNMSISVGSNGSISVSETSGNYSAVNSDLNIAGGVKVTGNNSQSVTVQFYNSAIYKGSLEGGGGWGDVSVQWTGGRGMQDYFTTLSFSAVE